MNQNSIVTYGLFSLFVKGISLLLELGKGLGSAIRRITDKKSCEI